MSSQNGESANLPKPMFEKTMHAISCAFHADLNEDTRDVYFESLKDLDAGDFRMACTQLIRESKWMPKVAEIRDIAEGIRKERANHAAYKRRVAEEAIERGPPQIQGPGEYMRDPNILVEVRREIIRKFGDEPDIEERLAKWDRAKGWVKKAEAS